MNPYAATTHHGTYAAYLGPANNGFLTQTLSTVPGETYTLEFWLASIENPNFGHLPNNFSVSWNGMPVYSGTNLDVFDFTHYSFGGLAATGTTTDLVPIRSSVARLPHLLKQRFYGLLDHFHVYKLGIALIIGGFSNISSYFALDDISVTTPIPEPSAAFPIGGALLLFGVLMRKQAAARSQPQAEAIGAEAPYANQLSRVGGEASSTCPGRQGWPEMGSQGVLAAFRTDTTIRSTASPCPRSISPTTAVGSQLWRSTTPAAHLIGWTADRNRERCSLRWGKGCGLARSVYGVRHNARSAPHVLGYRQEVGGPF